jgi:ML domain
LPSFSQAKARNYSGKNLTVEAIGTLSKDIEAGTKLFLTIKYNSIPLIKQEVDLCDQLPNVDLSCPLKKGPFNITKKVEITSMVPEGKYIVTADIYTEGHKEVIACLEGTAVFT